MKRHIHYIGTVEERVDNLENVIEDLAKEIDYLEQEIAELKGRMAI